MTYLKTLAAALFVVPSAASAATLTEIAAADGRFTTLLAAVDVAGLRETLDGEGPFTLYAPIDEAFSDLPPDLVSTLLKPENKEQLTDILLYHVDDRKLKAGTIPIGSNFFKPVLDTERMCITKTDDGLTIDDGTGETATVVVADIKADNGVIHVIDKVLLPGTRPSCGEMSSF